MLNKKLLALAILLSLLAAGSVFWYLNSLTNKTVSLNMVSIVTAAVDIPKNTVIKAEMLTQSELPQEYSPANGITEIKDAVGKIAATKVFRNQQLLKGALIEKGDKTAGLAYTVPAGKRAVTVAVDEVSGLDGQILPGDRVDVAATLNFDGPQSTQITQTSLILQNITVLAVGRTLETEAQSWLQRNGMEKTVTLAVTPKDAQPLILASERGTIRMLLRSPVDHEISNLGGLRGSDLLQGR